MPTAIPCTVPDVAFIVATAVLLLFQAPPGVVLDNAVAAPTHTLNVPVIGVVSAAFTVTIFSALALPQLFVTV